MLMIWIYFWCWLGGQTWDVELVMDKSCILIAGSWWVLINLAINFSKFVKGIKSKFRLFRIFESKLLGQLNSKYVLVGRLSGLGVMVIGMIILGSVYDIIGIAISLVLSSIVLCIIFAVGVQRLEVLKE